MEKFLAGSPYYVENVLGLDLFERAQQGALTHLLLNQPPICDCHCRRCFMPEPRRNKFVNGLTLEEYCEVIKAASCAGILCLEISGEGEPLLSENLQGIIQCAYESGLITTLITNGHALTPEFIKYIFDRNVTLVVSLFSLNANLYEMDNNLPGSFESAIKNIQTASQRYKDGITVADNKKVYRLAIHTTAQADNLDDLEKIGLFCDEFDIFFSIAPLAPVGGGAEINELMVAADKEKSIMCKGHNSIILCESSKREIGREVCGTCLYGLNIGYDGDVLFDAHSGYEIGGLLGNVRNDPFDELVQRQRVFAPFLFKNIDGFCPVRDPKWPTFLKRYIDNQISF